MIRTAPTSRAERLAAMREALDRGTEAEGECIVLVSRCQRCGAESRHRAATDSTMQPDEPCTGGLAHEWVFAGRSVVVGDQPWLGNVPGQRATGLHSLRRGDSVHVGRRSFTAPADGVYALPHPTVEPWVPVMRGDFRPTGDGEFVRTAPLVRLEPSSPTPSKASRKADRERQRQAIRAARAKRAQP